MLPQILTILLCTFAFAAPHAGASAAAKHLPKAQQDGTTQGGEAGGGAGSEAADGAGGEAGDDAKDNDVDEGTVTGKAPPPLPKNAVEERTKSYRPALTKEEASSLAARPYDNIVYTGARILDMDPEFINASRLGIELIYKRDYKGAKSHFDEMAVKYTETGIGPVGRAVIWQTLMLENFDFKYEKQYEVAFKDATTRLKDALDVPGSDAWENFLLGGILGIDAVHLMRKGNYVQALNRGYEAMRHVEACRKEAPDFPDLLLGDGIYNYWRSVVTMNSKLLPDFTDNRVEGIAQMKRAQAESIFLQAPATVALAFTYIEQRDFKRAGNEAERNYRRYPHNVINNLLYARIFVYQRQYQRAEGLLETVLQDAPDNERVHYYLSLVYGRTRRFDEAVAEGQKYLSYDIQPEYRSTTLFRLGNLYYHKKMYKEAEAAWEESLKADKHSPSKRRLEHLKQAKKDGTLPA
jgi:tetratricopeptide (TPR) repeat protein